MTLFHSKVVLRVSCVPIQKDVQEKVNIGSCDLRVKVGDGIFQTVTTVREMFSFSLIVGVGRWGTLLDLFNATKPQKPSKKKQIW